MRCWASGAATRPAKTYRSPAVRGTAARSSAVRRRAVGTSSPPHGGHNVYRGVHSQPRLTFQMRRPIPAPGGINHDPERNRPVAFRAVAIVESPPWVSGQAGVGRTLSSRMRTDVPTACRSRTQHDAIFSSRCRVVIQCSRGRGGCAGHGVEHGRDAPGPAQRCHRPPPGTRHGLWMRAPARLSCVSSIDPQRPPGEAPSTR